MDVILYSTNCPKCKVLEKKLNSSGIDYSIVTDVDVMEQKGFQSAPVLEVDDKIYEFSEAVKWLKG
jgi:glutaredoxin